MSAYNFMIIDKFFILNHCTVLLYILYYLSYTNIHREYFIENEQRKVYYRYVLLSIW